MGTDLGTCIARIHSKPKEIKMFTNRLFRLWMTAVFLMLAACSPQVAKQDEPITLRLAVADPEDRPSDPYVREFIEQVKTRSNGNITIEPAWDAGSNTDASFETGVIQLVKTGQYDLGLSASRAFDTENITSFQALQAPFLIDNDALAQAVATSDIATRMLENLPSAGMVGLTMWPEDLRHPFSVVPGKPILSPEDFTGLDVRATPSQATYKLIETMAGKPMFGDGEFQAAESGLQQGASLGGTPVATGNVVFFAKFQVLFTNGPAFEKLSETQRRILREAAIATQKKAIAKHSSEVDAAKAWCAYGGSIVLTSDAQVAAFVTAAQPVFNQLEQDRVNAELMTAIRDLKAKTAPSAGAAACAPAPATVLDQSTIPPELVGTWSFTAFGESWKAELTADGAFSLYGPDGTFDVGGSYSIFGNEAVFRDEKRGTGTLCFPAEGRYRWELTGDRLMFTMIEDKCKVGRIEQWTAGWLKVADQ
jgi:TRAP-type C4-dicarboxylate transport system substrate-binding protein